jgi:phospholipase/carboxylesterase
MEEKQRTVTNQPPLEGFTYVVSPPPEGKNATGSGGNDTFLLLHGTGGDEYDLLSLGAFVAPEALLISPRGRAPENGMNRWFARHAAGVLDEADIRLRAGELSRFVPAIRDSHPVGKGRIWALGFSNGANMAAAMLLLFPDIFAGAVLMRPMLPLRPDTTPNLTDVPVYIAAGTRDTMIPGDSTRELITLLTESGADLTTAWADGGHQFTMEEVEQVRQWYSQSAGS